MNGLHLGMDRVPWSMTLKIPVELAEWELYQSP